MGKQVTTFSLSQVLAIEEALDLAMHCGWQRSSLNQLFNLKYLFIGNLCIITNDQRKGLRLFTYSI